MTRVTPRARPPNERLLMSICLVLIFGICRILPQDPDPECGHSPVQDQAHRLHGELLQYQHPAPAQQGSIHLEGRILRSRSDQRYCPTLHVRKEGVLQIRTHTRSEEKGESKHGMKRAKNNHHLWSNDTKGKYLFDYFHSARFIREFSNFAAAIVRQRHWQHSHYCGMYFHALNVIRSLHEDPD